MNLEAILNQAGEWTFAGDCQLLQWMKTISQNLESRAASTAQKFDRLNNNIKCTHIALDNVTNSLTALQYGNQFVECRVEDDDETVSPVGNEQTPINGVDKSNKPTAKEAFAAFLDNNLKLLRIYEKYSIDVYDSDDDDNVDERKRQKTCIFQPVNPYNERPLPHIFGSKDWHMTSHVGLQYEQRENSYSGDEASDAFSESSLSAAADNDDSYETNSECASSFSVSNNTFGGNFEVHNATSTLLPPQKASNSQSFSETSSANSSNPKILNIHTPIDNYVKRSKSSSSTTSKTPSLPEPAVTKATPLPKSRTLQSNIPPYTDLFSDPPEDVQSTPSSSVSRKTINLFNDDDDEVYKHLSIAGSKRKEANTAEESKSSYTENRPIEEIQSVAKPKTKEISKPIFVDELQDKLFNKTADTPRSTASAGKKEEDNIPPVALPKIRTNLFDDEDDDGDFLSAFVKRQKPPTTDTVPSLANKSVVKPTTPTIATRNINLFEENNDDGDNNANLITEKNIISTPKHSNVAQQPVPKSSLFSSLKTTNLFDDDEDEDEENLFKVKPKLFSAGLDKNEEKSKIESGESHSQQRDTIKTNISVLEAKEIDLFKDDEEAKAEDARENDDYFDKMFPLPTKPNIIHEIHQKSVEFIKTVQKEQQNSEKDHINISTDRRINLFDNVLNTDMEGEDVEKIIPPLPRKPSKNPEEINNSNVKSMAGKLEINNIFDDTVTLNETPVDQSVVSESKKAIFEDNHVIPSAMPRKSSSVVDKNTPLTANVESVNSQAMSGNAIEDKNISNDSLKKQEFDVGGSIKNDYIFPHPRKITNLFDGDDESDTEVTNAVNKSVSSNASTENIAQRVMQPSSAEDNDTAANNDHHLHSNNYTSDLGKTTDIPNVNAQTSIVPDTTMDNDSPTTDTTPQLESNTSTSKTSESHDVTSSNKKTYNFDSSLLFDEPPDDNDFFESLGKSSQTPTMKFSGFDLEHDLYSEPELPKTSTTPAEKLSEYKGLQLFSDIPPEDNDFENMTEPNTKEAEGTKQLSSVFYDDFSETIEAIERSENKKATVTYPVFDNEPPAVEKESSGEETIVSQRNKDNVSEITEKDINVEQIQGENLIRRPSPNKHPIVEDKTEVVSKNRTDNTVKDEKLEKKKIEENVSHTCAFNKRPISKLQMPNLNINVQALLPGSVGKPNTQKDIQRPSETILPPSMPIPTQPKHNVDERKVRTDVATHIQQDHILPNVNKNRVRAPLNRRPSTRKARQENIRKSLLEEQMFDSHTEATIQHGKDATNMSNVISSTTKENIGIFPNNEDVFKSDNDSLEKVKEVTKSVQKANVPSLLEEDVNNYPSTTRTQTEDLPANEKDDLENVKEQVAKSVKKISVPSFLDDDDHETDDNELFKSILNKKLISKTDSNSSSSAMKLESSTDTTKDMRSSTTKPAITMDANTEIKPLDMSVNSDSNPKSPLPPLVSHVGNLNPLATTVTSDASKPNSNEVSSKSATLNKDVKHSSTKPLFSDSESESENDFFVKIGSTKQVNITSHTTESITEATEKIRPIDGKSGTNKHTSIFSDDSDDDEDFLKSSSKLQLSKSKTKSTTATHSSSIFSDIDSDDDDNDLFKSTPKATINPSATTRAITSPASSDTKQTMKTPIADNPLADLL
ncbi:WASH complex subunit 2 [Musca vetustissima]|uniref:WASH complex subunit 2 n=1 Tax=Musca vetustissima TaxID=27455 RepID=UPI002AB7AAA3|nr:WASH complex subunit 2 [Musca vetustissima]